MADHVGIIPTTLSLECVDERMPLLDQPGDAFGERLELDVRGGGILVQLLLVKVKLAFLFPIPIGFGGSHLVGNHCGFSLCESFHLQCRECDLIGELDLVESFGGEGLVPGFGF